MQKVTLIVICRSLTEAQALLFIEQIHQSYADVFEPTWEKTDMAGPDKQSADVTDVFFL